MKGKNKEMNKSKKNYSINSKRISKKQNRVVIAKNSTSGITLVALVITIVILLILASITMTVLLGENGLIAKAIDAKDKYEKAENAEKELLSNLEKEIDNSYNSNGDNKIEKIIYTFGDMNEEYDGISGTYEEFIVPKIGYYKLEVWGAEGGTSWNGQGGKGGYSSGYKKLNKGDKLYIYIGGRGEDGINGNYSKGGFNGGGNSGKGGTWQGNTTIGFGGGGGATDIRTIKASEESWYDVNHEDWSTDVSLLSRIIVAGGGGGSGEAGGGLTTSGATQETGYELGLGGTGMDGTPETPYKAEGKGGSGGGYYGGTSPTSDDNRYDVKGKGGSGYIQDLIEGTSISGSEAIPEYNGISTMIGNTGRRIC